MKIYRTQKEIEADIKDGVLTVDEDVKFEVSFKISAALKIAGNIVAGNIDAGDIDAGNINAWNIDAWNIDARDIVARDIVAWNIVAWNIDFFALAFAHVSFKCKSIKGRRENAKYGCLDSEVIIENKV